MFINGQHVVCIDDAAPTWIKQLYTSWITKGVTYVIRGVTIGVSFSDPRTPSEGEVCVYLVGVINPASEKAPFKERGFNAMRFRALDETPEHEIVEKSEPDLVGKECYAKTDTI